MTPDQKDAASPDDNLRRIGHDLANVLTMMFGVEDVLQAEATRNAALTPLATSHREATQRLETIARRLRQFF